MSIYIDGSGNWIPVPNSTWVKSSFSADSANCVEVAKLENMVLVRDSKNRAGRPLGFTHAEWSAFIKGAQAGEF